MKTYTIKTGQSNFRPIDWPGLICRPKGFEFTVNFDESCWYSEEELEGDQDYHDQNKLIGLTGFFSANNRNSCMVSWKPAREKNKMELRLYINDKSGNFEYTDPIIIKCGETYTGYVQRFSLSKVYTPTSNLWHLLVTQGDSMMGEQTIVFEFKKYNRWVGTSFGGANNSPGPYGGKAHKPMSFELQFNKL